MVRAALVASLTASLVLAGCGGTVVFDEAGTDGSGGAPTTSTAGPTTTGPTSGASTSGPTTSGPTTSGPTTSGPTTSGPTSSSGVTTGPSGGICGTGVTLFFGQFDACIAKACCEDFDACTQGGADVLGCQNCLDGFGGECSTALDCAFGCLPSGPECGSGLQTDDPSVQECLDDACCAAELFCTSGGPRLDDCVECLEAGGGPRCDLLIQCAASRCTGTEGICGSGLTSNDPQIDACLGDRCCDAYLACTDGGADPGACVSCFDDGGGARCDDAIVCTEKSGCFDG